ncbi:MAG: peptide chain release factor 1 [Candidatus Omnitrophica bacterium]|nr:peptide chain release factor 1 [Candidatus Omnitrophota bacterium]
MINYEKLKQEHQEIAIALSDCEVISDRDKYQKLAKRYAFLEKIIVLLERRRNLFKEKEHLQEVISDSSEDEDVRALANEELAELVQNLQSVEDDIEGKLFEESEPDYDFMIEIRSAAGGEESSLFAGALFKMYSKYIEQKGWKLELLNSSFTEIGGCREVIFSVKGKGAYHNLKFEMGVHRVQRVPATESSGRIHTSTVTVAILVEPKEVELKINTDDLKIDTYRSSGAGGQHVNVTDSAVRITHLPTGVVVSCQDERSQIKNRAKAMRVLKARILEQIRREEIGKVTQARRVQVGTGDRSEKIRTYNFPERRVTDHRINFTIYRLEAILEGNLDEIIKKLIKAEREKIYEAKGLA